MRSDELAERVATTVADAQARIIGVGAEQYDDGSGTQKFERKSVPDMLGMLREELLDSINYAVMLDVLAQRRIEELDAAGRAELEAAEADNLPTKDECRDYAADLSRAADRLSEVARLIDVIRDAVSGKRELLDAFDALQEISDPLCWATEAVEDTGEFLTDCAE